MGVYIGANSVNSLHQGPDITNWYLGPELVSNTLDSIDNYRLLNYVQSNGTAILDTKVKPSSNLRIQMKFVMTVWGGDTFIGTYDYGITEENDYRFFRNGDYTYFDVEAQRLQFPFVTNVSTVYELELGNYYVKNLNTGEILASGQKQIFEWMSDNTIKLFRKTDYGKIYYLKIWDGENLIRDYVPCMRNRDGLGGMYDLVNNKFYKSSGTASFIKGTYI